MADHVFVVMKWLHEAGCDHIGYTHQYHYQLLTNYSCQTRYGILAISCWMHYLVCIILVAER